MALVNATTTERLLRLVEAGKLDIDRLVTHSQSSKVPYCCCTLTRWGC